MPYDHSTLPVNMSFHIFICQTQGDSLWKIKICGGTNAYTVLILRLLLVFFMLKTFSFTAPDSARYPHTVGRNPQLYVLLLSQARCGYVAVGN